jgi:cell division protein FtsW (lipid II flippase)
MDFIIYSILVVITAISLIMTMRRIRTLKSGSEKKTSSYVYWSAFAIVISLVFTHNLIMYYIMKNPKHKYASIIINLSGVMLIFIAGLAYIMA